MESKGTFFTSSRFNESMAYEIELIFHDRELRKMLRGKFKVEHGSITVTAQDGSTKNMPLDGIDADSMARSALHEMELEKIHWAVRVHS